MSEANALIRLNEDEMKIIIELLGANESVTKDRGVSHLKKDFQSIYIDFSKQKERVMIERANGAIGPVCLDCD
jgi:hypothetical protein